MGDEKRKRENSFPRGTYWINVISSFFLGEVAILILTAIIGNEAGYYIGNLALLIFWIVLEVKRFHDANMSGWLALLNLIPGAGIILTVIFAGVLDSNYENNKWYSGE